MNFVVDIGNTNTKIAVIDENKVVARECATRMTEDLLDEIFDKFRFIDKAIVSATGEEGDRVFDMVRGRVERTVRMTSATPVPLRNGYGTPSTLGTDRLAAAVGAQILYGRRNMLIVDFGTAITVDLVIDGEFRGGNISPGAGIRFRALHDCTSHLPLCGLTDEKVEYGTTTKTAIEQGVMRGIEYEIEGYIAAFGSRYENLCTIFTGGDAIFFAKRIKNTIFASQDLIFVGLNGILEYNVEN